MLSINSRQLKIQKAFTLIELLVVIAIVGILAGMVVVNMSGATESARVAAAKVFSSSVRSSLMASRISEWRFDESSGTTAIDSLGVGNGVLLNGTTRVSGGNCVSEGCLQLDGVDDYVDTGINADLRPVAAMTLEIWAYPSSTQSTYSDIAGGHHNLGWVIQQNGSNTNQYYFAYWNGSSYVGGNGLTTLASDTWNHFTIVKNSTGVTHYLNGKIVASFSPAPDIVYGASFSMLIGNGYVGTSRCFRGRIDDVRLYGAALTASRIREDYLAGLDKLLASDQITQKDYRQRLADLKLIYATNE
ncbi:MAG: LamG-like jellyroll fold domain-containing protein [Candidatus Paceibacterota bacterium]|jgi:prepilin-type N-terminal cleavage/methylation domain-containing protein